MNKFKRQRRFQSRTDSGATFSGEPRAMRRKHDAVVYVLRMKPCVLKKQKHTMSMVNILYWTRPLRSGLSEHNFDVTRTYESRLALTGPALHDSLFRIGRQDPPARDSIHSSTS
jgi:hypothetical protein